MASFAHAFSKSAANFKPRVFHDYLSLCCHDSDLRENSIDSIISITSPFKAKTDVNHLGINCQIGRRWGTLMW